MSDSLSTTRSSLSHVLHAEIYPRLSPEDVFTHPNGGFQKSGDTWVGHPIGRDSKSGTSLVVTPSKLLFHDFGAGLGGGAIEYLRYLETNGREAKPRGDDFMRLAKQLAEMAGVAVPGVEPSPEEIALHERLETRACVLVAVSNICRDVLAEDSERAKAARDYLLKRGIDDAAAAELGVGLYPAVDEIRGKLVAMGFNAAALTPDSGVWRKMQGHVTFPWYDATGTRLLTIYGKHVPPIPEGQPKTMALPNPKDDDGNAILRTKSSPLYLDRALADGHKALVAVEGVTDAAIPQLLGATDTIAYVAATFSGDQIETLVKRGIDSVTIVPDPDSGGDKGALSSVRQLRSAGIAAYVTADHLPDELDPDEFIIRDGIDAWKEHVKTAVSGAVFQARSVNLSPMSRQKIEDPKVAPTSPFPARL